MKTIADKIEKTAKEIVTNCRYMKGSYEVKDVTATVIKHIEKLLKDYALGLIPEKVEEGEAMFMDDPDKKLSNGYTIGYNQAISAMKERIKT